MIGVYLVDTGSEVHEGACPMDDGHRYSLVATRLCGPKGKVIIRTMYQEVFYRSLPPDRCLHTYSIIFEDLETEQACDPDEPLDENATGMSHTEALRAQLRHEGSPFPVHDEGMAEDQLPPHPIVEPCDGQLDIPKITFKTACEEPYFLKVWREIRVRYTIELGGGPPPLCYHLYHTIIEEPVMTNIPCDPLIEETDRELIEQQWLRHMYDKYEESIIIDEPAAVRSVRLRTERTPILFRPAMADVRRRELASGVLVSPRIRRGTLLALNPAGEVVRDLSTTEVGTRITLRTGVVGSEVTSDLAMIVVATGNRAVTQ